MENQVCETGVELKLDTQWDPNVTGHADKSDSKKGVEMGSCCVQMTILDCSQLVPCKTTPRAAA